MENNLFSSYELRRLNEVFTTWFSKQKTFIFKLMGGMHEVPYTVPFYKIKSKHIAHPYLWMYSDRYSNTHNSWCFELKYIGGL